MASNIFPREYLGPRKHKELVDALCHGHRCWATNGSPASQLHWASNILYETAARNLEVPQEP